MTAVLAIHYQNDVLHADGKIHLGVADADRAALIQAARALQAGARACRRPIIHVRIAFRPDYSDLTPNCEMFRRVIASGAMAEGSWGAQFYEGLGPRDGEAVVTHNRNNAFHGSQLAVRLDRLGARRLVIAGVATTYAVEHTARHAADAGYEVVVARDACSAADRDAHEASLKALSLLATISTVAQSVAALMQEDREDQA